jgi:copper chaperone CopZ
MKIKPVHIVLGFGVLLIAVLALPQLLADAPGAKSTAGSVVTQTVAVIDTDATAAYPMSLLEGSDAEHELDHVVEALTGIPGVGKASLDTETLELTVAYDGSLIDDTVIRQALAGAGYVAASYGEVAAAELAEDGSVQRISVSDEGNGFDPRLIGAVSGVPIEIEFSPGQDCRVVVKFDALGVQQNIAEGGTVQLPALSPGEYDITCGGDGPEGTLLVK